MADKLPLQQSKNLQHGYFFYAIVWVLTALQSKKHLDWY